MLSTSAPTSSSPAPVAPALSPLPYYLAFAAGGRANGQYDAILPDVPAPAAELDGPLTPSSTPIDIPAVADKSSLPVKDGDEHDNGARGKPLSYDASTAAKEHDSHMHDTLHPSTPVASLAAMTAPPTLSESSSFGQDSYFVYSRPGAAVHAVGVADGVGGWRSQGVDSGVISRAMMDKCRQQAVQWDGSSAGVGAVRNNRAFSTTHTSTLAPPAVTAAPPSSPLAGEMAFPFSLPARLMSDAYDQIKEECVVKAGSTTACVLTLTAQRCMPSHNGVEPAPRLSSSATSSPNRSAPTSPPSSPVLAATSVEQRHQLSMDDEHKSEEKEGMFADVLVTQPAVDDVDVPLSGAASDSDEEEGSDKMDESGEAVQVSTTTSGSTSSASSLSQKGSSAFWSAVGHLIDQSHSSTASTSVSAAATATMTKLPAPASPATSAFSPPPSRPPSPSSPPIYLSCASIGDSGYVLFRHGRVLHRSDLQRTGRIVKQLAVIPPHLQGPIHRFCDDRPTDSTLSCHRVQCGDLLLVASDGLLDNLSAAGGGSASRHAGFVPWARFFLSGGSMEDDDREAIDAQNRRLEGLLKECEIDWEGRDRAQDKEAAVKADAGRSEGAGADGFVRLLCDRLVKEATQFMSTMDGKPDDVTVLVAQVCHL